jgi:ribonuclease HII
VVLSPERPIPGLRDSKLLTAPQRERLHDRIVERAEAFGWAAVEQGVVDRINVVQATLEAMRRALAQLGVTPELLLVDALRIPGVDVAQRPIIKGDRKSASIAAASIIAKVRRDALMAEYDRYYPQYGFARHKGYPTPEHLAALRRHGPCPLHRLTFHGVVSEARRHRGRAVNLTFPFEDG